MTHLQLDSGIDDLIHRQPGVWGWLGQVLLQSGAPGGHGSDGLIELLPLVDIAGQLLSLVGGGASKQALESGKGYFFETQQMVQVMQIFPVFCQLYLAAAQ